MLKLCTLIDPPPHNYARLIQVDYDIIMLAKGYSVFSLDLPVVNVCLE